MRISPKLVLVFLLTIATASAANRPPLVDAAKNGDKEALRTLLQKGANANTPEGDGSTALHWASYRDDIETADLLIRAGAKVNAANDLGVTPLWTASRPTWSRSSTSPSTTSNIGFSMRPSSASSSPLTTTRAPCRNVRARNGWPKK